MLMTSTSTVKKAKRS